MAMYVDNAARATRLAFQSDVAECQMTVKERLELLVVYGGPSPDEENSSTGF